MANIDSMFPPRSYSESSVSNILLAGEKKILLMEKSGKYKEIYSRFMESLSLYLSRLPNDPIKKYVLNLSNKDLIYIGLSVSKNDGSFVRVLISEKDTLKGVALDAADLEINVETGETDMIDSCVHAVYFGLIRASVLIMKDKIQQNKSLHKLLTTYLFLMILKVIGKNLVYFAKQKDFIHIICIYIYYKYFLKERHSYIISIIEDQYLDIIKKENFEEFRPMFKDIEKYESIKDIPKMLSETNLIVSSPNNIILGLLKNLKITGFYSFTGPLDSFIALVVLSKYPTDFFTKMSSVSERIHDSVENIMTKYFDKIKYETSIITKEK